MQRIAVIGAGRAGLDFALRCVQSGFDVTLEDVMPSRLRHALELAAPNTGWPIHDDGFIVGMSGVCTMPDTPRLDSAPGAPSVPTASSSGRVGSHNAYTGTLHLASTVENAVRDADLVIDFVPDELESKLEIFSLLDRMAPPRTILCTPTTALSIADLASCTYRPQQCFALELTNTAARLIHTQRSTPEATTAVEHWLQKLGFTVTTQEDQTEPMLVSTPHRTK